MSKLFFLYNMSLSPYFLSLFDSAMEKSVSNALVILFLRCDCHLGVKLKTIQPGQWQL